MLSGIKCAVCNMAYELDTFRKDVDMWGKNRGPLYWVNPKISTYSDVVLHFCGVEHSVEWYEQKREEEQKKLEEDPPEAG